MAFEPQGYRLKLTSDASVTHSSTVSAWAGIDGFVNAATQAIGANQPAYTAAFINGLPSIDFNGGAKSLALNNNTLTDNLFAGGGTLVWVGIINSAGGGSAGRVLEKVTSGGATAWNIVNTTGGSGFIPVGFNQATSGTTGAFSTRAVLAQNIPQIFTIQYDSNTPDIPPVIRVIGTPVAVTTTTAPTGTALNDSGGVYTIGNRAANDRGMDGSFGALYMWKRLLTDYDIYNLELLLANKWGVTLYDQTVTSHRTYYGGRTFDYSTPDTPGAVPMLLNLHGGGGSGPIFEEQLQLGGLFRQKAVLVFPTATGDQVNSPTWNSGGPQTFNNAPDSTYLPNLVDFVTKQVTAQGFTITEVYLVGHSNGGMMCYRLVIDHPTKFAGIFAMSADVQIPNPDIYTGRIQQWHGQDDANVPLAGGVGIGGVYYTPVVPTVQEFTLVNSGRGVVEGTQSPLVIADFNIVPSPAAHILSSIANVIINPPYSTTLAQLIYNFVFP